MARFIIDIASINPKDTKKICKAICDRIGEEDINYGMVTAVCIDTSDENQFYTEFDNGETNELTQEQIKIFNQQANQ